MRLKRAQQPCHLQAVYKLSVTLSVALLCSPSSVSIGDVIENPSRSPTTGPVDMCWRLTPWGQRWSLAGRLQGLDAGSTTIIVAEVREFSTSLLVAFKDVRWKAVCRPLNDTRENVEHGVTLHSVRFWTFVAAAIPICPLRS